MNYQTLPLASSLLVEEVRTGGLSLHGNFSNCHLINLLTGVGNQARGDNQTFTQVSSAVQRPLGWAYQEKGIVTAYLGLKPVSKLYDSKSD